MIHVEHLSDPVVETHGFPIKSEYCELYWLPIVGPTTLWMARRLSTMVGHTVEEGVLATLIGVGHRGGRNSPFSRGLQRLQEFKLAEVHASGTDYRVLIRTHLGPLPRRALMRLPEAMQAAHALELELHADHIKENHAAA